MRVTLFLAHCIFHFRCNWRRNSNNDVCLPNCCAIALTFAARAHRVWVQRHPLTWWSIVLRVCLKLGTQGSVRSERKGSQEYCRPTHQMMNTMYMARFRFMAYGYTPRLLGEPILPQHNAKTLRPHSDSWEPQCKKKRHNTKHRRSAGTTA